VTYALRPFLLAGAHKHAQSPLLTAQKAGGCITVAAGWTSLFLGCVVVHRSWVCDADSTWGVDEPCHAASQLRLHMQMHAPTFCTLY
jgi:hypothetical protein